MAEEEKTKNKETENATLKEFREKQIREQKSKKWRLIEDVVSAARRSYQGGFEVNIKEKTISFDKAIGDLIEALQKIKNEEIGLGGMGEKGVELPVED